MWLEPSGKVSLFWGRLSGAGLKTFPETACGAWKNEKE